MPTKTENAVKANAKKAASNVPQTKGATLKEYVTSMQGEVARALPKLVDPDGFIRAVQSALSINPQLQECTPNSFLGAMMMAAQLGLEPNTPLGLSYLLPFKNNKNGKYVTECQFILGYKGLVNLCYRSGQIASIEAHAVYEKDEFNWGYGLNSVLEHKPSLEQDRGKPTHFYALFRTKDGCVGFEVMSVEQIKAHAAQYSKSYKSGHSPWKTSFESMAKKTVLKQALRLAPLSTDLTKQILTDETIKSVSTSESLREDTNVLDIPNEVSFEVLSEETEGKNLEFGEQIPIS